MKLRIMLFSALTLFIISGITTAQDDAKSASAESSWTESQKFSYILGTQIGTYSKKNEVEVDLDLFTQGFNDLVKGSELAMSQAEINIFMASQQQKLQEKAQAEMMAKGTENTRKGLAFLGAK